MNKPVAYLHTDGSLIKVDPRVEIIDPDFIPLYTHPVKELTDEEIDNIIDMAPYPRTHAMDRHLIKVALKKAQEK